MGYREDVAIAFSSDGWNQFVDFVNSLESEQVAIVKDLVNGCDRSRISLEGDRLLMFDCIKVYADDFTLIMDGLKAVNNQEYLALFLGEDGAENFWGDYWSNPFSIGVHRMISIDPVGNDFTGDDMFLGSSVSKNAPTIPAPPTACVDDHTCIACGNNKCSKTEKSCWKCGYPI